MTATLTNFYSGQISATATDLAVAESTQTIFIGQLSFTNTSSSAVVVYVNKLATSGTESIISGGNWIAKKTIQPGKVWNAINELGALVLASNQTLSAQAGTTSVINCECAGALEV